MKFEVAYGKLCVLLFMAAASVYWTTLGGEFVLDDLTQIVQNPDVHTLHGTGRSLMLPTYPGDLYRPFTTLSYGLTYSLFGPNPFWFHLTNVLLHATNVVLIFLLLLRCFAAPLAAWTALLFAVLPIHSEAVANICGRTELLSSFFGLCFLNLLPPRGESIISPVFRVLLLSVLIFLSISSKESAVVFPALTLLLLWKEGAVQRGLPTVVGAGLLGIFPYLLLRIGVLGHLVVPNVTEFVDNPLLALTWYDRMMASTLLLGKYLYLSFFPWPLSADYSYASLDLLLRASPLEAVAHGVVVLGLLMLAVHVGKEKETRFFARWFFVAFLITANFFFPIGTIFGERLTYLPSVAVCGILALFVTRSCPLKAQELIFTVLALLYSAVALTHNEVWRSNESLARYQRQVAPLSVKSLTNYAVMLRNKGQFDEALRQVDLAQAIMPNYDQVPFIRATIFSKKGDLEAAHAALTKTLGINPNHIEALRMLGAFYLNTGDMFAAERSLRHILAIEPQNFAGKIGMFAVELKNGRVPQAARLYAELAAIDPEDSELRRLSKTLKAMEEEIRRR